MKFTILLLIALICISYQKPEWQLGTDESMRWSGSCKHVLHCQNTIGRTQDFTVTFEKEFSAVPEVAISLRTLDFAAGTPIGFSVEVVSVTTTGFTYRATGHQAKWIGTCFINYLAILDSNLRITYGKFDLSVDNLGGDGSTQTMVKSFQPSHSLVCDNGYGGATYILGANILAGQQEAKLTHYQSTSDEIQVVAYYELSKIDFYTFVVIDYCSDFGEVWISYLSKYMNDYPKLDGNGVRTRDFQTTIQRPDLAAGDHFIFSGITVIDQPATSSANFRGTFQNEQLNGSTYSVTLKTWANTQLDMFMTYSLLYQPQNTCAILYSECNFQGESIEVCSGQPVNSMEAEQWGDKNVRSVSVPPGRTLTLFDAENLVGAYTQVTGDVECSSGWTFTAPQ